MSAEEDVSQSGYEDGSMAGPGAPTPLSALEVPTHSSIKSPIEFTNAITQGVNGLTARDIKLVVDGGYHTVESVAYT